MTGGKTEVVRLIAGVGNGDTGGGTENDGAVGDGSGGRRGQTKWWWRVWVAGGRDKGGGQPL